MFWDSFSRVLSTFILHLVRSIFHLKCNKYQYQGIQELYLKFIKNIIACKIIWLTQLYKTRSKFLTGNRKGLQFYETPKNRFFNVPIK